MNKEKNKVIESLVYPVLFVVMLWTIKFSELMFGINFTQFGILPRDMMGLRGIITAPLIHGDSYHLISNTLPLIILGIIIVYFYRKIAFSVFFVVYFLSNTAVWIIATGKGYHLGASGLIYGFVSFLFFSGIFRSDKRSMVLSLIVVFVYGGLIWGIFPLFEGISWESHCMGAVSGGFCAYIYRKQEEDPEPENIPDQKNDESQEVNNKEDNSDS